MGGQPHVTHIDICRSFNSKTVTTPKFKILYDLLIKNKILIIKLHTQKFLSSRSNKFMFILLKALYFRNIVFVGFEMTLLLKNYILI